MSSDDESANPLPRLRVVTWTVLALAAIVALNAVMLLRAGTSDDESLDGTTTTGRIDGSSPAAVAAGAAQPGEARRSPASAAARETRSSAPSTAASSAAAPTRTEARGDAGVRTAEPPAPDHVVTARTTVGSRLNPEPLRDHGAGLVLSSSLDAPLRPGVPRTLTVRVRNGHPWPVHLLRTDVRVEQPDAAGCLPSWVSVERYRYVERPGERRIVIGGRSTTTLALRMELKDVDVNQNACKGTSFPLTLSARAAEVRG